MNELTPMDEAIEVQIGIDGTDLMEQELKRLVRAVLEREGQLPGTGVTLLIADDEAIRALNRAYRGCDEPTDVLAFPAHEASLDGPTFVSPEGLPPYLGDVAVSYPMAARQAAEAGHTVADELALLIVHGCLHLLGYDHATEDQQRDMWARQDEILQSLKR